MFKNILSFWKGQGFMNDVLAQFKEMLEYSERMYGLVCRRLLDNEDIPNLKEEIYGLDKKINNLERDIRKRIVEHLVMQPTVDSSACLVLMSVGKDAERLGDYCKNLYEITNLLRHPLNRDNYNKLFNGMHEELAQFFSETKTAFLESDKDKATLSWEHKAKISSRCDAIIKQLAEGDLPTNEAVCFTLTARHFKRLSSHLVNIATSVILPVDKLDYYDEKRQAT